MKRIYRYEVPVDDRWHDVPCAWPVLAVGCRREDAVEFWAHPAQGDTPAHRLRVYGTGHPIDDDTQYVGTAVTPGGDLVWHLMMKW